MTPRQTDVVPTLLTHLCIPIDPSWELDGSSLIEDCLTTHLIDQTSLGPKPSLEIFPNPAAESVNLWLRNIPSTPNTQLVVYSSFGKKILVANLMNPEHNLDVSGFPKGVYFFTVRSEGGVFITKRVVVASE